MLRSFGLYTHTRNNAIKSVLLIAGFPFVLPLAFFLLMFVGLTLLNHPDALLVAGGGSIAVLAVVILITVGWLPIAYFTSQWIIDRATGARQISRTEEPRLWNLLENLCVASGMSMPALRVIEDEALNAFASGIREGSYSVTVTRGLIEWLDDAELECVLAHELTHIRNRDVQLLVVSTILVGIIPIIHDITVGTLWITINGFYRLYSAIFRGLATIMPVPGHDQLVQLLLYVSYGALFVVGKAITYVISIVGYFFSLILSFALSRKREYLADAGAVELTKNPDAMIAALRKVAGNSEIATTISGVREMCFDNPHLAGIEGLFATHPTIEKRIEALIRYARDVAPPGLHLQTRSKPTTYAARTIPSPRRLKADYFPLLCRAIEGLDPDTHETRRAIYDRARHVLLTQLLSIDPQFSDTEIEAEQNVLEEAIQRVERRSDSWRRSVPERKRKLIRNLAIVGCVFIVGLIGFGGWKFIESYEDPQVAVLKKLRAKERRQAETPAAPEQAPGPVPLQVPTPILREAVAPRPIVVVVSENEIPPEVRATRDRLLKAAGNYETLRATMDINGDRPYLRYPNGGWGFELPWGQSDAEKSKFLRGLTWAITQPAGLVKDTYVWPYWSEMEVSELSSDQRAEMVDSRTNAAGRNFDSNWRLKINDAGRWISLLK